MSYIPNAVCSTLLDPVDHRSRVPRIDITNNAHLNPIPLPVNHCSYRLQNFDSQYRMPPESNPQKSFTRGIHADTTPRTTHVPKTYR